MFGSNLGNTFGSTSAATTTTPNPMKDIEVTSAPEDTVSALEFSPPTLQQNFLIAGGWDNSVSIKTNNYLNSFQKPAIFADKMLGSRSKRKDHSKIDETSRWTNSRRLLD